MADIRFSTPNPEEDSYSQAMEPDVADLIRYYTQPEEPQMTSVVPPDIVYDAEVGDYISREKAAARNAIRAKRANLAMDRAVYGMSPGYSSITMRDNTGPFAYMGDMPPTVRPPDDYGEPVAPKTFAQRVYDAGVAAAENAAYGALGSVTGGLIGEGAARNIKEFVSTSPYLRYKDPMSEAYANLYGSRRSGVEQYLSDSSAFVDELHDPYSKSRVIMHEKPLPNAQDYLEAERVKDFERINARLKKDAGLPPIPDTKLIRNDVARLIERLEGGEGIAAALDLKDHTARMQDLVNEYQGLEHMHEDLDRVARHQADLRSAFEDFTMLNNKLEKEIAKEKFATEMVSLGVKSYLPDMLESISRVEALTKDLADAKYEYERLNSSYVHEEDNIKSIIEAHRKVAQEAPMNELDQSKRALAKAIGDIYRPYVKTIESIEIPQLERGYRVLPIDAPASSFRPEPMSTNTRTTDGGTIYKNLQYINPAVTEEMSRLERLANDGGPVERSQAEMLEAEKQLNRLEDAAYREKLYSRPKPGVDINTSGMIRGAAAGMAGEAAYAALQESTSVPAAYVKEQVAKLQGGNYIPDLSEVPEIEKPAVYTEMLTLLNYGLPAGYFGSERHKREEEMSQNFGAPLTTEVKLARDMMKLTAKMQDQKIVKAADPSLVDQFKDFGLTLVESEAAAALAALL